MRATGTYREPPFIAGDRQISIERVGPALIRVDVSDGLVHGFTVAQAKALRDILVNFPEILA